MDVKKAVVELVLVVKNARDVRVHVEKIVLPLRMALPLVERRKAHLAEVTAAFIKELYKAMGCVRVYDRTGTKYF